MCHGVTELQSATWDKDVHEAARYSRGMPKTANEKLHSDKQPMVCVLDGKKAERYRTDSMLIPTPMQVRAAILGIGHGTTKTLKVVGDELAAANGAGVTCPMCMGMFWRIVAEAAEEDRADGKPEIAPWWRVTKEGKANPKMPGGEENHRALIASET